MRIFDKAKLPCPCCGQITEQRLAWFKAKHKALNATVDDASRLASVEDPAPADEQKSPPQDNTGGC